MADYSDIESKLDAADFVEEYEIGPGKRRVRRKFDKGYLDMMARAEGLASRRAAGSAFKLAKFQEPSD